MTYQWKFLADLRGAPGDVSLYGPAWAPQRNVTATADLNTFRTPGLHRITTPDTATILNLPPGTRVASELENITTGTGTDAIFTQRLTESGDSARTWWRSAFTSGGTFTPWALAGGTGAPITEWHVFLAVGQSNMSGRGIVSAASGGKYAQPRIAQFGFTRRTLETAPVPLDMHDAPSGLSPASVFANNYLRTQPDNVGVVLVPAAHGGTGFTTSTTSLTWTPNVATNIDLDLPKLAVNQTKDAIAAAKATGAAVTLKGILWHQGENNSTMAQATYAANLDALIGYFRAQLGDSSLPFIVGQMCPEGIAANTGRPNIDAAHQDTPNRVPYTGFAAATTGGYNPGDTTHMSKFGLDFLGRTYLEAYEQVKVSSPALAAVPGAVATYITNDPSVIQAAADRAASDAGLLPKWKPNTAYTAGQQVVTPDGDIVTRAVNGTSGATYTATNWTPSATTTAVTGKLDASQKGAANGIATLDAGTKVTLGQIPDSLKTVNGARPYGKGELGIRAEDYGCKGDYVSTSNKGTDNANALDALFLAAKAAAVFGNVCIEFGGGAFRTTREWDIYRPNSPRLDIVIKGQSNLTTFLLADFYGAGKSLIKAHDPAGVTRCSPTSIMHMQLGTVDRNGANPVLLDIYGHGESRIESLRFGPCNNTVMSIGALQNVRYRDIVSFYGGKHYDYRDTTGVTFSTTSGSTTLTSSADIFNGADAGRVINLYGNTPAKYLVATYVDARTVQISGTTPAVTSATVSGVFEPARITTTAGSNQASANVACFTTDDIGKVIYILGAKTGPWGESLLRARITGLVSTTTVTLDVTADIAKTRTEFYTPTIEFYSPDKVGQLGSLLGGCNDFKVDLLHIENYKGMGLVMQNTVFGHVTDMKIHGEFAPTNTQASGGAMWLDDCAGVISGELDGQATGDHRIYLSNMNDLLTFDWLSTRRVNNARIFEVGAMTDPGGIAEVRTFNAYTAAASGDPYDLIQDGNTSPRLVFTGLVNMLGDSLEPRIYRGKNTYHTMGGDLVTKSPDGTRYKITVANGGAISATVATG